MSYTQANKTVKEELVIAVFVTQNLSSCATHEQLKLVKENCWEKMCSSYTRARRATKEFVKENVVVLHILL